MSQKMPIVRLLGISIKPLIIGNFQKLFSIFGIRTNYETKFYTDGRRNRKK